MTTDRREHQLPINAVEVGFYVEIEHPVVAPTALTSLAHGIDRRFAGPVAIGVSIEDRLQTRLQVATGNFLGDSVSDSRDAQRARTARSASLPLLPLRNRFLTARLKPSPTENCITAACQVPYRIAENCPFTNS